MTDSLNNWLDGVPVIAFGNREFMAWLDGAPVMDIGSSGGGGGVVSSGARIVSPRQGTVNRLDFASAGFYIRRVSPGRVISRIPS